jgi:outer membrane protein OmpA-like peptidoglycan-associated protein
MKQLAWSLLFVTLAVAPASAQPVNSDDILKKLAPTPPAAAPGTTRTRSLSGQPVQDPAAAARRTRAIKIIEASDTPPAPPGAPPTVVTIKPELVEEFKKVKAELPKIDLKINFHFNSDRPTPEGLGQLHQLALALSKLGTGKIHVIGHTDAVGSDHYNLTLSQRRALFVVSALISHYKISNIQFVPTGFGKAQLLPGLPPDHEANRRVEVVNLGG